jgi:hypothetical protein
VTLVKAKWGMRMVKTGAIAQAKVIACLLHGATYQECADYSGLRLQTCRDYIKALRNEKVVFVDEWLPNSAGRITVASFKLGTEPDAVKKIKTKTEMNREGRRRKRQAELLGIRVCTDSQAS